MQQHIVTAFSDELEQLSASLSEMGGLAEAMLRDAMRAVINRDASLAQMVIARDVELDRMEQRVERLVVRLLALRQPMAADLRNVIGAIKIADALERIGDLAKDICRRSQIVVSDDNRSVLRGIEHMGQAVAHQLKTTLDALSRRDPVISTRVVAQDDDIDGHYNGLFRMLLNYMTEHQEKIETRSNFLFIIKNLERIGDQSTNIAKSVYFIATGDHVGTKSLMAARESENQGEGQ